jgi:hypothetical protein
MRSMKRKAGLSGIIIFLLCSTLYADDVQGDISIREEIDKLKARVQALEEKIRIQDKCVTEQRQCILEQDRKIAQYESRLAGFDSDLHRQTGTPMDINEGLEIGVGGTMVVQGTDNVNNASPEVTKKEGQTDAAFSEDITIGKEFKEIGGRAFLHLEAGQGAGLEDDLTLYSNVNRDADNDNNVRLTEFWYEQAMFADKAALTLGKLDPTVYFDNNEVANDETTQFLSRIFRNSPVIGFPDNTAGARLAVMPVEWLELGGGIFDGNGDWDRIGDNLFNIGQVSFKTSFGELPGNYRFLGWNNNVEHTRWLDTEKTKEDNYGFGVSFDQKVMDPLTLFTRYGWQDPKIYDPARTATGGSAFSLEHSWSAGLEIEGQYWGRENDVAAFAIGQAIPSDEYKNSGSTLDPSRKARSEGHIEAYYRIQVSDHLAISPDIQYIWDPFGGDIADDTDGVFVGGMRVQVDL